jgi:hypothetical protein
VDLQQLNRAIVTSEDPNRESNDEHRASAANSPARKKRKKKSKKTSQLVTIVRDENGAWEFKEQRCARARREDLEEVHEMIDSGEIEIAQDELRWLLSGCRDFMAAHKLLGDLALETGDLKLARAHYGYAYQIGIQAVDRAGRVTSLPYCTAGNRPFWDAARGLVQCLVKANKTGMVRDVVARLLAVEPSDPLGLKQLSIPDAQSNLKKKDRHGRSRRRGPKK